ncbi:MAG TPA: hypothetical protein DDW76_25565 [Cyanobacteria bacterium UBA11369]|nr:hypothetical protein [Cyanobacteria bacterium UBA8543]HAZ44770.1 hypothetical protein [Cyanobacteria bacterium UBA11371]HBE32619.1 hypothetical protein [Cyanobacteria bacterium UBA11368]HBE52047.1 hypothetical protein [Cyanobacteria bacterium UBA11369]
MTDNLTPNNSPKVPLGPAAAALISAAVGCFAMIVAHQAAIQSKALSEVIITLGSWIPDFIRVSSYPGEEAVGLLVWLTSWFILHQIWKQRDLPLMPVLIAFSGLILAATVMIFWHPI